MSGSTADAERMLALETGMRELTASISKVTEHSQANSQARDQVLLAALSEVKGAVTTKPEPIKSWVTGLQLVIAVMLGVGGLGGVLVAAGSTWNSTRNEITEANDRVVRLGTDTANKITQVEAEMRMRLDTARMEMTQADAIMRQQQQASSDQIRLLHTTDQAANERIQQVYQSLATITVQNQNLAERMSELGRRQDRLEARLGLSRDQRNAQPSGLEQGL